MKKFAPSVLFFALLIMTVIIGILINSEEIGIFFGALLALSTDPLVVISGIVLGYFIKNQIKLCIYVIIFGICFAITFNILGIISFTISIMIIRIISILMFAYISNNLVIFLSSLKSPKIEFNSKFKDDKRTLIFKNNLAAFEYACKFLDCTLIVGSKLPAIVLDSKKEFGTEKSIKQQDDGSQLAMIRIASDKGGFIVAANTIGTDIKLVPGDLIAWEALKYVPEMEKISNDITFNWIGLITGKLKPELNNIGWLSSY